MAQQFRDAFQRMSKNVGSRMPPGGSGGGGAGKAAGSALGAAIAAGALGIGAYNSVYTVQVSLNGVSIMYYLDYVEAYSLSCFVCTGWSPRSCIQSCGWNEEHSLW